MLATGPRLQQDVLGGIVTSYDLRYSATCRPGPLPAVLLSFSDLLIFSEVPP
ncbi:hypothetical protein SFR_6340 [Streptomyces sp. FR-008]|nr:hypothetical protein SFR_6340 [Streptomyces sp. FR-008]